MVGYRAGVLFEEGFCDGQRVGSLSRVDERNIFGKVEGNSLVRVLEGAVAEVVFFDEINASYRAKGQIRVTHRVLDRRLIRAGKREIGTNSTVKVRPYNRLKG